MLDVPGGERERKSRSYALRIRHVRQVSGLLGERLVNSDMEVPAAAESSWVTLQEYESVSPLGMEGAVEDSCGYVEKVKRLHAFYLVADPYRSGSLENDVPLVGIVKVELGMFLSRLFVVDPPAPSVDRLYSLPRFEEELRFARGEGQILDSDHFPGGGGTVGGLEKPDGLEILPGRGRRFGAELDASPKFVQNQKVGLRLVHGAVRDVSGFLTAYNDP